MPDEEVCIHGYIVTYTGQCPAHPELQEVKSDEEDENADT